jgi:hypothetical protein
MTEREPWRIKVADLPPRRRHVLIAITIVPVILIALLLSTAAAARHIGWAIFDAVKYIVITPGYVIRSARNNW